MSAPAKKVHWCNGVQNYQNGQPLPFHSRGASEKFLTTDVGDKYGKMIKLETLPKKATEIKSYFNYMVHDRWKNASLVLHVMSPKLF
eukprot:4406278-Ditylum_brightwellii.AAC.1